MLIKAIINRIIIGAFIIFIVTPGILIPFLFVKTLQKIMARTQNEGHTINIKRTEPTYEEWKEAKARNEKND